MSRCTSPLGMKQRHGVIGRCPDSMLQWALNPGFVLRRPQMIPGSVRITIYPQNDCYEPAKTSVPIRGSMQSGLG